MGSSTTALREAVPNGGPTPSNRRTTSSIVSSPNTWPQTRRRRRRHPRSRARGAPGVDPKPPVDRDLQRGDQTPARSTRTTVELRGTRCASVVGAGRATTARSGRSPIDPSAPCRPRPQYTATIKGGASGSPTWPATRWRADSSWTFTTAAASAAPAGRRSGRTDPRHLQLRNPSRRYYAEILRAEGLNEFTSTDISNVTPAVLNAYDVVILGESRLSAGAGSRCSREWVQQGGNLIAMRPDPAARRPARPQRPPATLAECATCWSTRRQRPGAGNRRPDHPVPRHRRSLHAQRRRQRSRRLYSDASTATSNPAVTLRSVGAERRAGRGLHLRPRAVGRLHAAGQSGLGRAGARRHRPDPLRRPVLRREPATPARLDRPEQGRDPTGRRTAATARRT